MMVALLGLLATLGAALFVGGAFYISIVEHPARMAAGPAVALAESRQMYRRAAPWQASTAALSLLAAVALAIVTGRWPWALAGLLIGAVIPFTLLVIKPTNDRLLASEPPGADESAVLLRRWGRLHWIRSALSAVGLLAMLWEAWRH